MKNFIKSKKDDDQKKEEAVSNKVGDVLVAGSLVAKKDFIISWNDYLRVIQAGDDLSDVPQMFHQNLKTEGVI